MGPIQRLSKGAAGLVGLAQEAHEHNKQKKEQPNVPEPNGGNDRQRQIRFAGEPEVPNDPPPPYRAEKDSLQVPGQDNKNQLEVDSDYSLSSGSEYSPPPDGKGRLPAPVVIPQRRPGTRGRGFITAYAPALADCGISESQFLDFLKGLGEAITANQAVFGVLNLAAVLANISTMANYAGAVAVGFGAMAVQMGVQGAQKAYANKKQNEYLEKMNEEMFHPSGLHAMIMKYDPSSNATQETIDFNSSTASAISTSQEQADTTRQRYKTASGETLESQMPEVCDLIFPDSTDNDHGDIDNDNDDLTPQSSQQSSNDNSLKRGINFARDYYDRRSQAQYAAQNPDSTLNVQEQTFAGKYGDPTSFDKSGPLGVLTGGAIDPTRRRAERREAKRERRAAEGKGRRNRDRGDDGQGGGRRQRRGGLIRRARRAIRVGVIYLLIINLPSEEKMREAAKVLEKSQGQMQ